MSVLQTMVVVLTSASTMQEVFNVLVDLALAYTAMVFFVMVSNKCLLKVRGFSTNFL